MKICHNKRKSNLEEWEEADLVEDEEAVALEVGEDSVVEEALGPWEEEEDLVVALAVLPAAEEAVEVKSRGSKNRHRFVELKRI